MEINKRTDITGVITTEDIVEGRFVLATSHPGYGANDLTGRLTDVPGVKLPDTPAEAVAARTPITWQVSNQQPPYISWTAFPFALRQGFDQDANVPLTDATVYLTYPGYQESVTIPSGTLALAYGGGVFTLPSGQYMYNATMQVPGTALAVADTETDGAAYAGMPKVASGTDTVAARVERFNTTTFALTLRTHV